MQDRSFSSGRPMLFNLNRPASTVTKPYDSSLLFNKIVDPGKNADPTSAIYSIDAAKILKVLEADNIDQLFQITLACRPTRNGVGMWDTLHNSTNRQSMNACVFAAASDYTPLSQDRVAVISHHLNYAMLISRIQLNQLSVGDKVGISINDISKGLVYILLYTIDTMVNVTSTSTNDNDRSHLIPGVNLTMNHALRIDDESNVTVVDMQEDQEFDNAKTTPFVQWLVDTVYNIVDAYPWKPHFLPYVVNSLDREVIEARLIKDKAEAKEISYSEFQELCRSIYRKSKGRVVTVGNNIRKRPGAKDSNAPRKTQTKLPVVEVATIGETYYAKFDGIDDRTGTTYAISVDGLEKHKVVETFFTNNDLIGINVIESSKVMPLSPGEFGENSYLRYFTLNF